MFDGQAECTVTVGSDSTGVSREEAMAAYVELVEKLKGKYGI